MMQTQRVHELDHAKFEGDPIQSLGKPIGLIKKKDNKQLYAMRRVKRTEPFVLSPAAKDIHHPFIAHLAFTNENSNNLYLYSPFISGGHLFNHLQKVRQFDVETSRIYAAEIICALEYLHTLDVCCWLKAENIMLDSLGHITLCGFGLFRRRDGTHRDWKRPEYPAPEVLMNDKYNKAADWWTLGVFLYEMLTGLPPFYSDVLEDIRNNIISKPLHLPESMHANAKDILVRLLHRDPEQRLGVNGASEFKQHAFFQDLDWQQIIERRTEPSFQPGYRAGSFEPYGVDYPHIPEFGQPEEPTTAGTFLGFDTHSLSEPGNKALNTGTGTRAAVSVEENPNAPAVTDENIELDTTEQIRAALEVALKSDREDTVAHLLESKIDLSTPIFEHTSERTTMFAWVIRHGSLNMLTLILSKADVKSRDRVSVTLALGLATRMRNIPAANILLSHGTRCDFEDADIPVPANLDDPDGDTFRDPSDPREFTPALVSAVLNRDVDLARMLLAHGANPNLGYHGVRSGMRGLIAFSCGRIVQLAMELRLFGMAQLLLEYGADIGLAAPVWEARGHDCGVVPRAVYQRVTAALRKIRSESLEE
ncbi:kinase-like protein [Bimuria novae-zelandiae CBS 107.79]|uniref:Kinase-like protein n=1 Tax=Bimuria novae-zelandiae CBS 107.79 TaxID=1447943 RepID=A0A6A5V4B9_9PLEO|nr:kinase-like protein [Bimuria novae-zelandiae CBS 107.79]